MQDEISGSTDTEDATDDQDSSFAQASRNRLVGVCSPLLHEQRTPAVVLAANVTADAVTSKPVDPVLVAVPSLVVLPLTDTHHIFPENHAVHRSTSERWLEFEV